jgi:peptide subunit release factor 1 (eRF1)
LAADALTNVKFIREKKLLSTYFSEISQDTGKYCFGIKDTLLGLEMVRACVLPAVSSRPPCSRPAPL